MGPVNLPAELEVYSLNRSGVPENFGQPLDTPLLPFVENFRQSFVRMDPVNVQAKVEVRSFPHS